MFNNNEMTINFDSKTIMINVNKQNVVLPFDLLFHIAWSLTNAKNAVMVIDPSKVKRINDNIVIIDDSPSPMSYSVEFIQKMYDKWRSDYAKEMKEFNE